MIDIDELTEETRQAIIDRFEGWEIVEFLQIPIERIVEDYETEILDNLEDIEDLIGLRNDNDNEED